MDEINPTQTYSFVVLVVRMMMQLVSLKNYYFAQNAMHPHTHSKMDHTSLIFDVGSSISFKNMSNHMCTCLKRYLNFSVLQCDHVVHVLYKVTFKNMFNHICTCLKRCLNFSVLQYDHVVHGFPNTTQVSKTIMQQSL